MPTVSATVICTCRRIRSSAAARKWRSRNGTPSNSARFPCRDNDRSDRSDLPGKKAVDIGIERAGSWPNRGRTAFRLPRGTRAAARVLPVKRSPSPLRGKLIDDGGEKRRCNRQIKQPVAGQVLLRLLKRKVAWPEIGETGGVRKIDRLIGKQRQRTSSTHRHLPVSVGRALGSTCVPGREIDRRYTFRLPRRRWQFAPAGIFPAKVQTGRARFCDPTSRRSQPNRTTVNGSLAAAEPINVAASCTAGPRARMICGDDMPGGGFRVQFV